MSARIQRFGSPGYMKNVLKNCIPCNNRQLSGNYDASNLESLPALFLKIFWWGAIGGGLMLLLTPMLKRLMPGVK